MKAALHAAKAELARLEAQRAKITAAIEFLTEQVESSAAEPVHSQSQTRAAATAKPRMSSVDVAAATLNKAGAPLTTADLFSRVAKQLGLTGKHARATFTRALRMDDRFRRASDGRIVLREWTGAKLTALPSRADDEDRGNADDPEDAAMTG
jgi:hypothetical protein